jgi:hypothetical protein
MAKYKISWSVEAEIDLTEILEFYIQRNKTVSYSKKLYLKSKKIFRQFLKIQNQVSGQIMIQLEC